MVEGASQEGRAAKTPPYVSYKTLTTFLHDLKEHGIPTRIDRSVLTRFSGVVGTQLMTALRFFRLIDDQGRPSPQLQALVKAFGTPEWPKEARLLLKDHYSPLFQIDLATATPSHFTETFRAAFPGSDAVIQKSIAFFVQAAKEAGVEISPRVLKGKKPRTANGPRRKPATKKILEQPTPHAPTPPHRPREDGPPQPPNSYQLLALLDPNTMSQEEQSALLLLIQYLRRKEVAQT